MIKRLGKHEVMAAKGGKETVQKGWICEDAVSQVLGMKISQNKEVFRVRWISKEAATQYTPIF
jgi:hypothetical protein